MSGTEDRHPIFARFWARVSPGMDRGGLAQRRSQLLEGLHGRVIEVGAGDGLNFAHYPAQVSAVVAVEPEPYLRDIARRNAEHAPVPIEIVDGLADELPVGDEEFDAAVACQVLCSVPDQLAALGEMRRVVKPDGELRFLEHVRADTPILQRVQRVAEMTIWPALFGGCHPARDIAGAIQASGFGIEQLDRFNFPDIAIRLPASPHIVGMAHRLPSERNQSSVEPGIPRALSCPIPVSTGAGPRPDSGVRS